MEKNFFVDDYLKSVESHEKAITSVVQLRNLLARRSFNLTKWVYNSRAVLEKIPRQLRASGVQDLDLGVKFFQLKELLEYVGTSRLMCLFSRCNSKGGLLHEEVC